MHDDDDDNAARPAISSPPVPLPVSAHILAAQELGLQVLSRELLDQNTSPLGTQSKALIITPRPAGEVLRSLRESLAAQMQTTGAADSDADNDGRVLANCLERVMLSCVFDMDGLCEVLSDLDDDDNAEAEEEAEAEADNHQMEIHKTREIQDSQDADEEELLSTVPPPPPPDDNSKNSKRDREKDSMPSFILVTHFSTLLGGLFAQRERQAAHTTVSQVGARLGHLSRNLASSPLIMILNSVTETPATVDRTRKSRVHGHAQGPSTTTAAALDPSLQSIFSPPLLDIPGYNAGNMPRRVKPSFGLVFAQLLDMHLLCSRVARTGHDGTKTDTDTETGGVASERGNYNDNDEERGEIHGSGTRFVTIVEVLMDDMGVWQGRRGPRPSREQRWTAVDVFRGRVSCAM
ncbi:hypothetical protein E4U43_002122 [Claviceps pusilla]|uniref:Uncharacterized protein n=1 Tax=Claviceps pusilla TaxID=123648 RepID=A0A9P7T3C6_9HYPO|nr:hypothetical protein E4U43_002122 [Claviceps pusilla]